MEEIKKQYPLLSILQLNLADKVPLLVMLTTKILLTSTNIWLCRKSKRIFQRPRLKWVFLLLNLTRGQTFELYAIKFTERNGKAPLKVT